MSLKHGLLGLLNYGSMTGYELDKAFSASLNFFWQAQTSQIYRELNAMEKLGWLTSEIVFQTDKPNKKLYSITDTGKTELMDWLGGDVIGTEFQVRSVFLMKLFFCGERDTAENIETLKEYRRMCMEEIAGLERTDGSIDHYSQDIFQEATLTPVYWGLTADFGKAYMQMCLEWADRSIGKLEEVSK